MTPDTPNEERTNEAGSLKELAREKAEKFFWADAGNVDGIEAAIIEGMKAALETQKSDCHASVGIHPRPGFECGNCPGCDRNAAIDEEIDSLRSGEALK